MLSSPPGPRCVVKKHLPLPERLPECLARPSSTGPSDQPPQPQASGGWGRKGSKDGRRWARRAQAGEATGARSEPVDPATRLQRDTAAFKAGKTSAAAFYFALAQAFGSRRHAMIPKARGRRTGPSRAGWHAVRARKTRAYVCRSPRARLLSARMKAVLCWLGNARRRKPALDARDRDVGPLGDGSDIIIPAV